MSARNCLWRPPHPGAFVVGGPVVELTDGEMLQFQCAVRAAERGGVEPEALVEQRTPARCRPRPRGVVRKPRSASTAEDDDGR